MGKVIEAEAGRNIIDWLGENMSTVRDRLDASGIVLLRGFDSEQATTLKDILAAFGSEPMQDARWSTPRSSVGEGAFTSTEYPADQWIVLHSEMSYARLWPRLLLFQCKIAAETGGATTICDLEALSADLSDLVSEFHEREVIYLRNFRRGVDVPWQHAFGTEDRDEVERIGAEHGLEVEWQSDGTLRTSQQAQGAIEGPNGPLWFNQAQLFHPCQLPAATRKALEMAFGSDGLPRNAIFGDGEPIPDATINHILDCLSKHTENIDWQAGDVAIIDNMRWMHGRAPFTGTRKVLAAMGRPHSDPVSSPLF